MRRSAGAFFAPNPARFIITKREGFAEHSRTSFAPETIATRRDKHRRTGQISRKINANDFCPAAHIGLVGGSSPPGPTRCFSRYSVSFYAKCSRSVREYRWPIVGQALWKERLFSAAHHVRDVGVAGSNPATPTRCQHINRSRGQICGTKRGSVDAVP